MKIFDLQKETNLKSHLVGSKVILDFYASWCGPCKVLSKTFQRMADDNMFGDLTVLKVNIDDHQELAQSYNVRSLPTMVFTESEAVLKTKIGNVSQTDLATLIGELYD